MGGVITPPLDLRMPRCLPRFWHPVQTAHWAARLVTESQSRAPGSAFRHGVAVESPESQSAATVTSRSHSRQPPDTE